MKSEKSVHFPENFAQAAAIVAERKKMILEARGLVDNPRVNLRTLSTETERHQFVVSVLEGLMRSWADVSPGKLSDAFFFIDESESRIVLVRDFLPPGTFVCGTRGEWNEYAETKQSADERHARVPHWFKVVPLGEVARAECFKCHEPLPLIGRYADTYEGAEEGDTWAKERFTLCLSCEHITEYLLPKTIAGFAVSRRDRG